MRKGDEVRGRNISDKKLPVSSGERERERHHEREEKQRQNVTWRVEEERERETCFRGVPSLAFVVDTWVCYFLLMK